MFQSTLRSKHLKKCLAAALAAGVIAAFAPALECGLISYDDSLYVTGNQKVQAGLTIDGIRWAFTTGHAANWHPITWLSHMLDVELYGPEPWGHHLTSLGLHSINTVLLFLLLTRLTGAPWRSFFVSGIFALHPLRVESVVWIAERKDVLSVLFGILSTWAYVHYCERPERQRYATVALLLMLSLMSKPMLVTLPFVFLLLDYWPLGRIRQAELFDRKAIWRLAREKLPLLGIVALSSTVTLIVQEKGGALSRVIDFDTRVANAIVAYLRYAGKLVWPADLVVFYPHPGASLPALHVVAAAGALVGITAMCWIAARKRPYLAVGWLWFVGTLIPVIGLVQVGAQAMADRYTYWPMVGLAIALVWGINGLLGRGKAKHQIACVVGGALLIVWIPATRAQTWHWSSSQTLFEHALRVTAGNHLAHKMLALDLAERGQFEAAVNHLSRALELDPADLKIHNNLGNALVQLGRFDEAIEHFESYLRDQPDDANVHFNLGIAFFKARRFEGATASFGRAVQLDPQHEKAHYSLGLVLNLDGKLASAATHYERAVSLDPDFVDAHYNLAVVLTKLGDRKRATTHFRETLRLEPQNANARRQLEALSGLSH